jgi:hypothetical protein
MKRISMLAGTALLAAACGGSPASGGAKLGSQDEGAVAFAHCMRSHGVTRFPDTAADRKYPSPQRLGVGSSQFQAAQRACQHLLGASDLAASVTACLSTGECAPALLHRIMTEGLAFARCMRAHGVPNWPDPTLYPEDHAPIFNLLHVHGFDPRSPQVEHQMDACRHVYSAGVRVGLARP